MPYRTCLFLLVLVLATSALAGNGEPAPNFNAKTTTGEKFTNDSLKGHVVLLQFWTTWCPYCRREQPIVDDLDKEFRDQGLVVLAVDVNESKKKVKQYLEQNPRACRIVLTEDTNLAAMYAAHSFAIYACPRRPERQRIAQLCFRNRCVSGHDFSRAAEFIDVWASAPALSG